MTNAQYFLEYALPLTGNILTFYFFLLESLSPLSCLDGIPELFMHALIRSVACGPNPGWHWEGSADTCQHTNITMPIGSATSQ